MEKEVIELSDGTEMELDLFVQAYKHLLHLKNNKPNLYEEFLDSIPDDLAEGAVS